jgi:hypothetical protein
MEHTVTKTIKAYEARAGQTIVIHNHLRSDTWVRGDLTVKVSRDVRYGRFQADDDQGVYIHGERDDGADYAVWIYDLAEVEIIEENGE